MAKKPASPSPAELLHQAFALHQQNRLDDAWALYAKVLALDPRMPDALHLSACIAIQRGMNEEAARRISAALAIVGPNPMYLTSLGNALAGMNRHDDAEAAYRRAIAAGPASAAAHNNLGNLLIRLGRYAEAMTEFEQTLACDPRHLNALLALGHLLADRDAPVAARQLLERARGLAPGDEGILLAFARACCLAGDYAAAMEAIDTVRRLHPGSAEAHTGAGTILGMLDDYGASIPCFRRALELAPDAEHALNGLIESLIRVGFVREAIDALRLQTRRTPFNPLPHSSLLFLQNYLADIGAGELAAAHREWNARFALPIANPDAFTERDRDPDRRLRIGYVSADFRAHSVSFFIEPILAHHDRRHFEVYAYHTVRDFDSVTARLKSQVDAWRDVATMGDRELADLIRSDAIDILVDLGGHTGRHRLLCFARQPAPVQVSYLGYPNTTGLTAIGYRISDARADPPGESDALSSEHLLRLPECFHCYRPTADGERDFTPPFRRSGQITFGSFNVVGKISEPLLDAWARILHELPGARLLLKTRGFADPIARAPIADALSRRGIAAARVVFSSHQDSRAEHMARYREVDIALDTFPYNGTTTTCDALWMGVPVIGLVGDRHAARVGSSLLHACGLDELVAESIDDYVERAIRLAGDGERLDALHGSLRERLRRSPLMAEREFALAFEAALREAWRGFATAPAGADRLAGIPHWRLSLAGDIRICVPASVEAMTPAILLEIEDWFEDEIAFVRDYLAPGMQVIDVGANYGVYALNAARCVGPGGRVWAFEPAPNTRRFLEASRLANDFAQLAVEAPAISDADGEAWMSLDWNPELNRLVEGPTGGPNTVHVPITSLDAWHAAHPAVRPDFLKIDAEGHERRVIAGARRLLTHCSPLVMFELRHLAVVQRELIRDLMNLGYATYRLVPGPGVLAPFDPDEAIDPFQLNLFAARAPLARKLADAGHLALALEAPPPSLDDAERAALARDCGRGPVERRVAEPAARRLARLAAAETEAARAATLDPQPLRLLAFARIARAFGHRDAALRALQKALAALDAGACGDADGNGMAATLDGGPATSDADAVSRLTVATLVPLIEMRCFAGFFAAPDDELPLIERALRLLPRAPRLERRRQLARLRAGLQRAPECIPALASPAPDNRNPDFWCPGGGAADHPA